ncbi:MAG: hypothetical protein ABIH67_02740 [Candidatus Uhrbacteria bacterium]
MIYLIGGSPRSGKTTLSIKLSKKLGVPWISSDYIRSFILPYIPKKDIAFRMPIEEMFFKKSKCNNDLYYQNYSLSEQIQADIIEGKTMWPGIKRFIENSIWSKNSFIIDGVHLLPEMVSQFKGTSFWKNIKIVYLVKTDEEKILPGFWKSNDPSDWLLTCTKKDKIFSEAAKMVAKFGRYLEKEAKKYGLKVYNTDQNFQKKINQAVKNLSK